MAVRGVTVAAVQACGKKVAAKIARNAAEGHGLAVLGQGLRDWG